MSGQCYVSPHLSSSSSFFFSAFSPSSRQLQHIYTRPQNPRNLSNAQFLTSISASSLPRRRRRSHLTPPTNTTTTTYVDFSDKPRSVATSTFVNPSNLELSFDVDRVASYLKRYCNDFLSSGEDAFHDLRSSVRVRDEYGRRGIVFSCRKSSVLFVGNVLIYCSVGFLLYRVFGGVLSWFRLQWSHGNWSSSVVTKRDRSLGGKEVVVARKSNNTVFRNMENDSRKTSPLSLGRLDGMQTRIGSDSVKYKSRKERIPEWWPVSVPSSSSSSEVNDGSSQKEASMLVREIVDNRMAGKDFNEYDIIQLRRICRGSDIRVKFDTENTRDSFFRATVDFILNVCIRAGRTITADHTHIDGEEVRHFLAGLSYNIKLQNYRAAILINAAVAVKTRSCFLQAWALEVQGKYLEALEELSKISSILHTFPPDDGSPEMEMVASGLRKNLKIEQRKHLLNLFHGVSNNAKIQRIASAALDLQQRRQIGFDHSNSNDKSQPL